MNKIVIALSLIGSVAFAQSQTMSINTTSASASQIHDTMNLSAKSKAEALQTESMHYSLPRADMSYFELGAFRKSQSIKSRNAFSDSEKQKLNHNAFYFKHSRGLTDNVALDAAIDFFMLDSASPGSSGVNEAQIGLRSNFIAMDLHWIYGASLGYLPNGDQNNNQTIDRVALTANIGFEEAVDIARWGLQLEGTSKDSAYDQNQMHFIGFFEIPFVQKFNTGVAAGMDVIRLSNNQQNAFAKIYGQYNLDPASAVQLHVKQVNQKSGADETDDAEVGLSVNRVF